MYQMHFFHSLLDAETQYLFFFFLSIWTRGCPRHMNIGTLAPSALDWSFISAFSRLGEGVIFFLYKSGNI